MAAWASAAVGSRGKGVSFMSFLGTFWLPPAALQPCFGSSGPAIHGRALGSAAGADRAPARRASSPSARPAACPRAAMPSSASCWRMASARAKSRACLAALRSSTRAWMRASSSPDGAAREPGRPAPAAAGRAPGRRRAARAFSGGLLARPTRALRASPAMRAISASAAGRVEVVVQRRLDAGRHAPASASTSARSRRVPYSRSSVRTHCSISAVRPVQRLPVVRREQRVAQRLGRVLRAAGRARAAMLPTDLDILAPPKFEHAVVQPEARERLAAVGAFALRDFVLVVRELQVDAAGVDVDGLAQVRLGHRRALDVPARAAAAPGRVPAGQVVAWTASTARSRRDRACTGRPPRARRPAFPRCRGATACRSRRSWPPRTARGLPPRRRGRRRSGARSSR